MTGIMAAGADDAAGPCPRSGTARRAFFARRWRRALVPGLWFAAAMSASIIGLAAFTGSIPETYTLGMPTPGAGSSAWHHLGLGLLATDGLAHAGAYLGLFVLFGRTILPGRQPLVTQLATRVDAGLTGDMRAYTRAVTVAWTCFFIAQPAISAILAIAASAPVWWLFVNGVSWLSVIVMFAGEYVYRRHRFPDRRTPTFAEMTRAFREQAKSLRASRLS